MSYSSQTVRFGTLFDTGNDQVTTPVGADALIHIRGTAGGDPDFAAVVGTTLNDPVECSAEYLPEEMMVRIQTGWAMAAGTKPRIRSKRGRTSAASTDIALEVIPPDSPGLPEDGENRAYFLNPVNGQTVEVELLDYKDDVLASITLECVTNPPAADKTHGYVAPGQECYVIVAENATDLDATTDVVKEPGGGWTGRDDAFISDIKARFSAMVP